MDMSDSKGSEKMEYASPTYGVASDRHAPTMAEYMYYAKLKRDAERGGYSGNG